MNPHDIEPEKAGKEAMELFDKQLKKLEKANPTGVTTGQITRLANKVTRKYNEFTQRRYCASGSH